MSTPQIIFGCASFGAIFTKTEHIEEVATVLQDAGVLRIDTAARYPPNSPGQSEKLIGEAHCGKLGFQIDTKIYISGDGKGSLTASAIEKSLSESLKTLGVAKINTLYCHGPDEETPIDEQAAAFDKHYRADRFEHLGVSNFSLDMLDEWLLIASKKGYVKPTYYQGQYNALCRGYEETLFPYLCKHNIHFTAFSPLAGGFLTGKLSPTTDLSSLKGTRFEVADSNFMGKAFRHWYDKSAMHTAIDKLRHITGDHALSMEEASVRWIFYHSALTEHDGVIIGASKASQIVSTTRMIKAGKLPDTLAKGMNEIWYLCKEDAALIIQH